MMLQFFTRRRGQPLTRSARFPHQRLLSIDTISDPSDVRSDAVAASTPAVRRRRTANLHWLVAVAKRPRHGKRALGTPAWDGLRRRYSWLMPGAWSWSSFC